MYPRSFQHLIDQFSSLPGIGPKMAERLVLFLFKQGRERIDDFAHALGNIKNISTCTRCFNITESDTCSICNDKNRDQKNFASLKNLLILFQLNDQGALMVFIMFLVAQ
jgi:recombination protein RecR